jgi:hypothetical protein
LKKKKKKQSQRSKVKHPALKQQYTLRSRAELLEYDYLHKLSEKELDWLNKFSEEYISASFDTKHPRRNLHRSKAMKKKVYDQNNARNRDLYTKAKMSNKFVYLEDVTISEEDLSRNLQEPLHDLDDDKD